MLCQHALHCVCPPEWCSPLIAALQAAPAAAPAAAALPGAPHPGQQQKVLPGVGEGACAWPRRRADERAQDWR